MWNKEAEEVQCEKGHSVPHGKLVCDRADLPKNKGKCSAPMPKEFKDMIAQDERPGTNGERVVWTPGQMWDAVKEANKKPVVETDPFKTAELDKSKAGVGADPWPAS